MKKYRQTAANTKDGYVAITRPNLAAMGANSAMTETAMGLKNERSALRFLLVERTARMHNYLMGSWGDAAPECFPTDGGAVLLTKGGWGDHPSTRGKTYLTIVKFVEA